MRHSIWIVAVMVLGIASSVAAQDRYLLLATTRTGTMLDEVNEAAERSFRVVAASRTEDSEVIVAMERAEGAYHYRLLATRRTGTLQKELNEAAEAGYRVVPRAVTTKRQIGSTDKSDDGELLVLMEKGPDTPAGVGYIVLATRRTSTLQKEMSETAERGYELVALSSRGEHIAVFEHVDQ
jgi:hypothetical protein